MIWTMKDRHGPSFFLTDKAHNVNVNSPRRDQPLSLTDKARNIYVNINSFTHGAMLQSVMTDTTSFCRRPDHFSNSIYWPEKVQRQTVYAQDLMSVEPFKYLENFKNPCFLRDNQTIPCFPYYFLIGAAKSRTTDLSYRIKQHPQVTSNVQKEPHWITWKRFSFRDNRYPTIYNYIENVFSRAALDIAKNKNGSFHPKVVGDCSSSTISDNNNWPLLKENQNRSEPLHTNADYIYHLNPNAKIIAILRNPIDRLYSMYLYLRMYLPRSREDFHERANRTINYYNKCFARCSSRHCVNLKEDKTMIRVSVGLYYYYIYDWMRVFPRDQVLVVKTEDYSANMKQNMKDVFHFLELEPLDNARMAAVANTRIIKNKNNHPMKRLGMLPETRTMLYNFYKQHNEKIDKLLGTTFWEDDSS